MNTELMRCADIRKFLASGGVLIDVMTPEDYAACHIPGAINCCIYEVAFLDRVRRLVPDEATPLVVYDVTGATRTAHTARQRLIDAGYEQVRVLDGGLAAWFHEGREVEGDRGLSANHAQLPEGTFRVDTEQSRLEWIGRNISNRHYGRISLSPGSYLDFGRGTVLSGRIVLDMRTITDLDLDDPAYRAMLIAHLQSEDFFAVERYPTATLALTSGQTIRFEAPDIFRLRLNGDLTIRRVSRPIFFPATVIPQPDGGIKLHAAFSVDRILWDVSYGSSRLFERLGMHLVDDEISLELFVTAAAV